MGVTETTQTPDAADFSEMAAQALASLPEHFRAPCENVAILVEDLPDKGVCRDMALASPYDLLGLYDGVDIVSRGLGGWDGPPDVILIYRLPILDFAAQQGHGVRDVIAHVLIHEIGHHFGFSDDDMAQLEAEANIDHISLQQHLVAPPN